MTLWEGLILGIIQGATEFLPVSSSGHLVMGQILMGVELPGVWFEVAVHLATLVSILLVYRSRVAALARGAVQGERSAWGYLGLIVLATIPAGLAGVFLEDRISALFDDPRVTGVALLATGLLLLSSRRPLQRGAFESSMTLRLALVMGLTQAFAIIPGISRSGSTVVAGLWAGAEPDQAAEFSFLMAIPAIGGAAVLKLPELLEGSSGALGGAVLAGTLAAAITGVLAIWTFIEMLRRRSFPAFGLYCLAVGAGFLVYLGTVG
jgi:undecaprenyl-diphosphatase